MLNKIFIALLLLFAGVWIWSSVAAYRQRTENDAFYAAKVLPYLKDSDRKLGSGEKPLEEWIARRNEELEHKTRAMGAQVALMFTIAVWMIVSQVQLFRQRRKLAAPDRPAAPDAGKRVNDLTRLGQVLIAKSSRGTTAQEISVDGGRRIVVFRNYAFVTSFLRNPKRPCLEITFGDILTAVPIYGNGRAFLSLRTTHGKALINDSVHPFPTLAELLLDIVEVNRKSPALYREALAREPKVDTPWWGWLIIIAAVSGVFACFWAIL